MPSLFTLPHVVPLSSTGALLAGAKLTFSISGSATLQNTYTDYPLTTPNANPVIADSNGVFPLIYLDPSLPNYRVKLTTSADVLIVQDDNIPSNQNTAQTFRLKYTAPEIIYEETDASANNKKWSIRANNELLSIDILNDAESLRTNIVSFTRTGATSGQVNFADGSLLLNSLAVGTTEFGSFSGTLTGMGSTTTGNILFNRSGSHCVLHVDAAVIGTSNATSMTLTGLPTACRPTSNVLIPCVIQDNGAQVLATAFISGVGTTVTFRMGSPLSATGFTNTGFKGLPQGFSLVYNLAAI